MYVLTEKSEQLLLLLKRKADELGVSFDQMLAEVITHYCKGDDENEQD